MCSSRKSPYPPHGRSLETPRWRGVLEAKILEAKYELIQAKTNERKVLRFGDILAPLSRETKIKYAIARVTESSESLT